MKIAILIGLIILSMFAVAAFYPTIRERRRQKKLNRWRDNLIRGDNVMNGYGSKCQLLSTPDINGDCKIKIGKGIQYTNINKLYPLEGGEK